VKKGFSLIELIVVVAIIAIISSFAMPNYMNYREKLRAGNAEANLLAIYNAEKRYMLDNGTYCANSNGCSENTSGYNLETKMGVFIHDANFKYEISPVGSSGPSGEVLHYTVEATRYAPSPCAGKKITVSDGSYAPARDASCSQW